jgi:hypothetical protein
MQSVPITTNVSSNPTYVIKVCQLLAADQWFFPGTAVSSTNNSDRHDTTVEKGIQHHNP